MDQPIYVDKALFLGRVQQQNAFRAAMREVLDPYNDNDNPYVILLYGDGGMGKTTLSKRLRDIVRWEAPFEGEFELLWIDWEEERRLNPHLQGGRENITPETVFDTIHTAAIRQKWGRHFKAYQRIVDQRAEAEHAAAQALAGDWAGETSALRSLSADAVGKLVRNFSQVPIGDTGEKWVAAAADVGLKLTTEQARKLSEVLQTRLKSRLKPEQFNIYLQPQAQLASALADGLGKIAQRRRLLLVLDTYEIVDYADHWLRKVIADAGSRIVWLISGRDNLAKSRSYGTDYFLGYEAQFAPRLLAYDLPELALADLQAYFAAMVPDRPLSDEEAQMVNQATRGIPLALRVAAEMWAKGTDAADIVGDTSRRLPARDIVGEMTGRYLLHVVKEDDRQALYALALAQGNQRILRAMLTPDDAPAFDWLARVEMLQRAYASVHLEEMRLHDEPALYLRALLRRAEQRERPQVRQLYQRAVAALRQQIAELEEEIPLIEERCEDEEWSQVAIDLAGYLFGLDEREGWQWLLPRFVESLAYSRDLRAGLLNKARDWQDTFSRRGQLRLKKLESGRSGSFQLFDSTPNEEMLEELRKQRHWLVGAGEAE
ncbi:MAG: FUSC family protein, partial [Anaerolineae bacterium]|nr:FUSC family protein [Anaerolineae bacterium]